MRDLASVAIKLALGLKASFGDLMKDVLWNARNGAGDELFDTDLMAVGSANGRRSAKAILKILSIARSRTSDDGVLILRGKWNDDEVVFNDDAVNGIFQKRTFHWWPLKAELTKYHMSDHRQLEEDNSSVKGLNISTGELQAQDKRSKTLETIVQWP